MCSRKLRTHETPWVVLVKSQPKSAFQVPFWRLTRNSWLHNSCHKFPGDNSSRGLQRKLFNFLSLLVRDSNYHLLPSLHVRAHLSSKLQPPVTRWHLCLMSLMLQTQRAQNCTQHLSLHILTFSASQFLPLPQPLTPEI